MRDRSTVIVALAALLSAGCGGSTADPAPVVSSFEAGPASIVLGAPATLAWTVTGATSIAIDNGIGLVTGERAAVVPGSTTTYTLTATGPGGTVTRAATLVVTPPPTVLEVACSGSSCGAANPYTYSGAGIGIWRFHNGAAEPRTVDIHVGGVTAGDEAVLVFSNGTRSGISPLPSAGSLPTPGPAALRIASPDDGDAIDRAQDASHHEFLEENRALGLSLRAAARNAGSRLLAAPLAAPALAPPAVGDLRNWFEVVGAMTYDTVAQAVCDLPGGRKAVLWVDPASTASGSLLPEDLAYFRSTFCGPLPSDADGGFGRVTALLGDVWGPVAPDAVGFLISDLPALQDVNVVFLEVPGAIESKVWAGYFWGGNNFRKSAGSDYASSNEALAFFIDASLVHTSATYRSYLGSALLHELTHMANFYQRSVARGTTNDTWLEETTATMIEDVVVPVATPDHYSSIPAQRIRPYVGSGGAITYMAWLYPDQNSYSLAGAFGAFLNRRYGTSILTGTIGCTGGGVECLDGLIRAGGGAGFADEFGRVGASIFGLLPLAGTPDGYGYPQKVAGAYTLASIDVVAYASKRKTTATALGEDFAAGSHTYQIDTVPTGRGVYSRIGVVVPGGTSILLVIQSSAP